MATHLPRAGSQRWLESPQSPSPLQVRKLSGVQPLKFLQLGAWPGSGLSEGQHCLAPPWVTHEAPRGQSALEVQALPQNFSINSGSRMQLSWAPPHSLSERQLSQKL